MVHLHLVEVNSSGEFIYTQIVNENLNQTQTIENYVENPRREKPQSRERERVRDSTKSERLPGFPLANEEEIGFIAEG